ncbi:probable (S)-N-methylcoclaurine 3'-hydroxylase isozyme 2 [Cornus florida]|uniref:probable (S)-N-methylcoclaurine 3'-hydroxylase isozyme 2 n=1 Tax=Cornus florida TaxID=4283 RepID=UPI00289FDDA7|nr:probable (S)-N-methylcoclaurine 3'-hydroxylase isozyme 2 [Cornus florida]
MNYLCTIAEEKSHCNNVADHYRQTAVGGVGLDYKFLLYERKKKKPILLLAIIFLEVMVENIVTEGTYDLFFSILLLAIIFLILKLLKSNFLSESTLPLPPGPSPWPILGNILQMGEKPHITLANFARSYGPLMSLRLGTQIMIIGSSPAAAVEILKTNDRTLSARYVPHVAPPKSSEVNHLSLGWALECNDAWKKLRSICRTELFSGKAIESQACLREKKIRDMVRFLSVMEGKVVKVGEVIFATVFNMLGNVFISRDFISLEEENLDGGMKDLVREIMEVSSAPNLSDFYPILGALDLQGLRKKSLELFGKVCAVWEPVIEERRDQRRGGASSQKDLLDTLIDTAFTNDKINTLFMELFTAGTDTSTSTVEWAMAELIKNPESMKKVCEELTREINQHSLKESDLAQLPYLEACVKETLRLHPPAPLLLPHRAPDSCKVMNYTIPKNSQVVVNVWAIGRDPMVWEEPLKFKPERFLNTTLDFKGNDFEFLPFGAGRRICPGLPMAAKQVPLILASLFRSFDWSLPHGNDPNELDMNEKFAATLQKEQPLVLIPTIK